MTTPTNSDRLREEIQELLALSEWNGPAPQPKDFRYFYNQHIPFLLSEINKAKR